MGFNSGFKGLILTSLTDFQHNQYDSPDLANRQST